MANTQKQKPALPEIELGSHVQVPDSWRESILGDDPSPDPDLLHAVETQRAVSMAVEGLVGIRKNRHPTDTAEKHLDKIATEAAKAQVKADTRLMNASQRLEEREKAIAKQLEERIANETQYSAELRRAVRELLPKERLPALRELLGDGDVETILSVMAGPPMASGLSVKEYQSLRNEVSKRFAADLIEERQKLAKTKAWLGNVQNDAAAAFQAAAPSKENREQYAQAVALHEAESLKLSGL